MSRQEESIMGGTGRAPAAFSPASPVVQKLVPPLALAISFSCLLLISWQRWVNPLIHAARALDRLGGVRRPQRPDRAPPAPPSRRHGGGRCGHALLRFQTRRKSDFPL